MTDEEPAIIAAAERWATGATIHDVKGLIGCYRACAYYLAKPGRSAAQIAEISEQRDRELKTLAAFMSHGDYARARRVRHSRLSRRSRHRAGSPEDRRRPMKFIGTTAQIAQAIGCPVPEAYPFVLFLARTGRARHVGEANDAPRSRCKLYEVDFPVTIDIVRPPAVGGTLPPPATGPGPYTIPCPHCSAGIVSSDPCPACNGDGNVPIPS